MRHPSSYCGDVMYRCTVYLAARYWIMDEYIHRHTNHRSFQLVKLVDKAFNELEGLVNQTTYLAVEKHRHKSCPTAILSMPTDGIPTFLLFLCRIGQDDDGVPTLIHSSHAITKQ